jgi:hypothetical protein
MKLSGHKTMSVFRRYDINSAEEDVPGFLRSASRPNAEKKPHQES